MSKPEVFVTLNKDSVVTENEGGMFHKYYIKDLKFNEKAENAIPAVSADLVAELYQFQNLGYKIIFCIGDM